MNKKLLVLAAILFGAALFIGGFFFNQVTTQFNQPGWMMSTVDGESTSGMMGNSGMMGMMSQQGSGMMNMMHNQNGSSMMGNGQHGNMMGMMNDGNCGMMETLEHHPDAESHPANNVRSESAQSYETLCAM